MFVSPPRAFATFLFGKLEVSAVGPVDFCAETGLWIIKDKNV